MNTNIFKRNYSNVAQKIELDIRPQPTRYCPIKQINDISAEGADIVRVSCPDKESTFALKEITKHVSVPIVADIHFHYKRAIEAAENGAKCLRINPGNIGDNKKIKEVILSAKNNNCSI